jgi:ribonuclease HI
VAGATDDALHAAVDGSALGNPGPAGWAWYIDEDRWAAGGWPRATNNQGELQAVSELLRATAHLDRPLHILCDSQYVINAVTSWLPGWKRRGWKKADGKPVLNREQLQEIDAAMAGRDVTFEWVKGHNDHELNEAADLRARAAATAFQRGEPVPAGPGLGDRPDAGAGREPGGPSSDGQPGAGTEAPRPRSQVVTCTLEAGEADEIVRRARDRGVRPQEELARLIRAGMSTLYT